MTSFPNHGNKHNGTPLFSATDFLAYLRQLGIHPSVAAPEGLILSYHPPLLRFLKQHYAMTKIEGFDFGEFLLINETNNRLAIIGNFGIGAPVSTVVFEEMFAYGVKRFISIGTAGSLQADVHVGDIVVCNAAVRDEGTSYHYCAPSKYAHPSPDLTRRLSSVLERHGIKFHTGTTWTTDAPYRETVEEIALYQNEGVLTVEMEAAALFAVAGVRNADIAAMFTVSDTLASLKWQPQFHTNEVAAGLENLYRVAAESLLA